MEIITQSGLASIGLSKQLRTWGGMMNKMSVL